MSDIIPFKKDEPSAEVLAEHGISLDAPKIDDVSEMGHVMTHWHFSMIQDLHHKMQMPEDVGIDIPTGELDADGKDICVDGNEDHRAGFLAGIAYALERLDTFPIKGVPEDEADDEPQA